MEDGKGLFCAGPSDDLALLAERFDGLLSAVHEDWPSLPGQMEPLTEDGGVMKTVLRKGDESRGTPPPYSTVTLHYHIMLKAGGEDEPMDSSVVRGVPDRKKLGEGQLLPGLELLLATMQPGQLLLAILGYQYAYGELGFPPKIGPKAEVVVFLELVSYEAEAPSERLLALEPQDRVLKPFGEICAAAVREKENGNNFVKEWEYDRAGAAYRRAVSLLLPFCPRSQEEAEMRRDLLVGLHLNTAFCALKQDRPDKAAEACRRALDLDPDNVKALYRYGKAKRMQRDNADAKLYFLKALAQEPRNKDIARELRILEEEVEEERRQDLELYSNMFKPYQGKVEPTPAIEEAVANMHFFQELQRFKEDPEVTTVCIPDGFFAQELEDLKEAARILRLKVRVEHVTTEDRNVHIKKPED